jgi:Fe-S-cluster-containing dehydrogenase component
MNLSRRAFVKSLALAGATTAVCPSRASAREPKQAQPDDVGMLYDSTRCIGCRACMTACKEANELPTDLRRFHGGVYDAPVDLNESTKNIIKLYRQGDQVAYAKIQCMHCVDPACVSVCMAGALHQVKGGIVAYNKDTCVGCRY